MDAHDFLIDKFGHFNPAHPVGHLGYTKGRILYIEDIIAAMDEYKQQSIGGWLDEEIKKSEAELEYYRSDGDARLTLVTWIAALLHVKAKVEELSLSKRPVL